jgi:predicted AlkP superfamily pyrophosphatase or phosphodiesterase
MTFRLPSVRALPALVAFSALLPARPAPLAQAPVAERPRLYVIVAVDQMRGDYYEMYGKAWTQGLKQLADGGAWFRKSAYTYMNTITCAGHATIGTGTVPAVHGMVLNQWVDRATMRATACTDDPAVKLIHYNGATPRADRPGNSASRLLATTFADELRGQATTPPRVVSVSLKPRSAIGMAGHAGDVVLWFNESQGWTTSTAYAQAPLPWLKSFIDEHPVQAEYGKAWTKLLPDDKYRWSDDGLGEGQPVGWTTVFPHPVVSRSGKPDAEFLTTWSSTPFADAYTTRIAVRALDELKLGQAPGRSDVLAISYSVLDSSGHAYGPRSHEVQDTLARLDVTIGELLAELDKRVGRDNYLLAFTGDHGVSPIPEQIMAQGEEAVRVPLDLVRTGVDKALEPYFGPGPHVAAAVYTDIYFVPGRYEKLVADKKAMRAAIQAIENVPGVWRVYRADLLAKGDIPKDGVAPFVARSLYPERSGDLLLVPRRHSITSGSVATHGTLHDYDTEVPLILFGAKVKPGKYGEAASPADIAPTFAHLAGVTMPKTDGRVLKEALP